MSAPLPTRQILSRASLLFAAFLVVSCTAEEHSADEDMMPLGGRIDASPETEDDAEGGADAALPGGKLANVEVPAGEAATAGRLITADGRPIDGVQVLCCSSETCLMDSTDADGVYLHVGIDPTHRYKIQVTDPTKQYSDLIYFQPYVVDTLSVMETDVIVHALNADLVDWPADTGGDVTLAAGELTLTAAPGVLEYPLGKPQTIQAERVPVEHLPPYDPAPWSSAAAEALAYVFTPATVEATAPVSLRITLADPLPEGVTYTLWSVDSHTGGMVAAGTATATADGELVAEDTSTLTYFSTLVLFPDP